MTKSNSLRSLKKRRKSVDRRASSVKKQRRKVNRSILQENHKPPPEEEEAAFASSSELNNEHAEENKEWFPWLNSTTLSDFYSWCQSTVTEVRVDEFISCKLAGYSTLRVWKRSRTLCFPLVH